MQRYILRRLVQTILLIWLISVITFVMILAAPGGPSILFEPGTTLEQMQQMKHALGLDQPLFVQYARWLGRFARGDMGTSLTLGMPVRELIASRLPATLLLSGAGLLVAVVVGVALGVLSAVRRNSAVDHLVTAAAFFGVSVPVFWYGLLLIMVFAVRLRWLPAGDMVTAGSSSAADLAIHLVLPALVLGTTNMASIVRYTRSSMIAALRQDYVRTARAKGLPERRVVTRHALRNALIPILTVIGLLLPRLAAGAAVTEQVFAWPGMGLLAVRAAFQRDYPTIMGVTIVVSVVVTLCNLVTDIAYALVDPRIRFE